jgi:hypothetical protein
MWRPTSTSISDTFGITSDTFGITSATFNIASESRPQARFPFLRALRITSHMHVPLIEALDVLHIVHSHLEVLEISSAQTTLSDIEALIKTGACPKLHTVTDSAHTYRIDRDTRVVYIEDCKSSDGNFDLTNAFFGDGETLTT